MEFGLKDIIYCIVLLVTVLTAWFTLKNKVNNLMKDMGLLKKIIFTESGLLNLLDTRTCREKRDEIKKSIESSNEAIKKMSDTITKMDSNIRLIMYKLKVDEENGVG